MVNLPKKVKLSNLNLFVILICKMLGDENKVGFVREMDVLMGKLISAKRT